MNDGVKNDIVNPRVSRDHGQFDSCPDLYQTSSLVTITNTGKAEAETLVAV